MISLIIIKCLDKNTREKEERKENNSNKKENKAHKNFLLSALFETVCNK